MEASGVVDVDDKAVGKHIPGEERLLVAMSAKARPALASRATAFASSGEARWERGWLRHVFFFFGLFFNRFRQDRN
jgi:hypothetical protein